MREDGSWAPAGSSAQGIFKNDFLESALRKRVVTMKPIYLDYAATTPVEPQVAQAMQPYFLEHFGNPSSPHAFGREAKKAVEDARQRMAELIGAQPSEMIFNSGGTEGNNHVLFGVARVLKSKGRHIITSKIEHHSVKKPLEFLEKEGFQITYLPVDGEGLVDPEKVLDAVTPETILVSIMHASNEVGSIQPLSVIGRGLKERGILFHTDAVQTVGHIPVDVKALNVDFLTLAAHKFYGPKGVGALYVRQGFSLPGFLLGGDQERSRRASTLNVPGIVGLKKAVELCQEKMAAEIPAQIHLRDRVIAEVLKRIKGSYLNGHCTQRLPGHINISFDGIDGESLLMLLDMKGIAVSMGSACTAGVMEPSYVLKALGRSSDLALGSLRISLGRWTTAADVDVLLETLAESVTQLRR